VTTEENQKALESAISNHQVEILLAAYEFARETRDQADTITWEIASIVWGGQTLLLGFVLEAISGGKPALILIHVVAILGIIMMVFNDRIMRRRSAVCEQMIDINSNVEDTLKMKAGPQHEISATYTAGAQRNWYSVLNVSFGVAWAVVFCVASYSLFRCR
jgi:hypothetical protein